MIERLTEFAVKLMAVGAMAFVYAKLSGVIIDIWPPSMPIFIMCGVIIFSIIGWTFGNDIRAIWAARRKENDEIS